MSTTSTQSWLHPSGFVPALALFVAVVGSAIGVYASISSRIVDHESRITSIEHTIEKSSDAATAAQLRSYDLLLDISNRLSKIEGSMTATHPIK